MSDFIFLKFFRYLCFSIQLLCSPYCLTSLFFILLTSALLNMKGHSNVFKWFVEFGAQLYSWRVTEQSFMCVPWLTRYFDRIFSWYIVSKYLMSLSSETVCILGNYSIHMSFMSLKMFPEAQQCKGVLFWYRPLKRRVNGETFSNLDASDKPVKTAPYYQMACVKELYLLI